MASDRLVNGRVALLAAIGFAAVSACAQDDSGPRSWEPSVVAEYPHDPNAFTQGLVVHDGYLYEGTGQYGESSLRRVDIETGQVEQIALLNRLYFGEGITIFGDRIYQLTWRSGVGLVYDRESFEVIGTFRYAGEGWGLTHDGERLIMSDGSATLRFMDPETLEALGTLGVRYQGRPVERLNELEYVNGEIWSNVWYDDRIARISPESGEVLGWIDLSELYPLEQRGREDVLNGIAYDAADDRLFVTGKNWPRLFEIEFRD